MEGLVMEKCVLGCLGSFGVGIQDLSRGAHYRQLPCELNELKSIYDGYHRINGLWWGYTMTPI